MDTQMTREEIKAIIVAELPRIIEEDPEVARFILNLTKDRYADKNKTEDRIERLLDELKRDREENTRKWKETSKRLDEQGKRLDEFMRQEAKKWEEQNKKWEEQNKKWEEQNKKWEEQNKKWEEQNKKWEENQKVIRDMLESIKALSRKHDSTIGALGARWGLYSEAAFRNGLKAILEDSFGVKVERYQDLDTEGKVFGRPDQVEMDVIIHDGTLVLCEIKSSMSWEEMYVFQRKREFYEEKHGRKADRVIVISPMVEDKAKEVAGDFGIEVYGYAEDVDFPKGS